MSLLSRVARFAGRHQLWRADTRVVLALSGGSDSVALLCLLRDLHQAGALVLDAAAHLNHLIRGADADADEAFCGALANRLGVPLVSARVDVPAEARQSGGSIEVAGRRARRRFLDEVRRTRGADRVATAHTEDDQAETVLLNLVRGTGLKGLAGMAPRSRHVIRPLLECSRGELRDELEARGEAWREDATNRDVTNPRNRVRHEVLPYLAVHFNPATRRALARLAGLARADEEALDRLAASAAVHMLNLGSGRVRLDPAALASLPDAVARRVVRYALRALRPGAFASHDEVEAVREVAAGGRPSVDLPGVQVEHSGGSVVLIDRGAVAAARAAAFCLDLPVPGLATAPDGAWTLEALGPFAGGVRPAGEAGLDLVEIDADAFGSRLMVRSRRPGDRLQPVGLGGRKKVQDVLVDRKVPRADRDRVPIVTDARGRIVWLAGHALDEAFRVTDRTNAVVILQLRRIQRGGRPAETLDQG